MALKMWMLSFAFLIMCCILLERGYRDFIVSAPASKSPEVLVLGSGGLIGTALSNWLIERGYQVLHVYNRTHIDLRQPHSLDQFNNRNITFAFFLACEVGGSKFLYRKDSQEAIIQSNLQIYQNVFPWLQERNIPFVFTSSYLQFQSTTYGTIKRLGEKWMEAMGIGRSARLWNVYGEEEPGVKSHVVTDWIQSCIRSNRIDSLTNGNEMRQFLHADDCAAALGTMIKIYDQLPASTDVSSGSWQSMKNMAHLIANASGSPCEVSFSTNDASIHEQVISPMLNSALHSNWRPTIDLRDGIARLYAIHNSSDASSSRFQQCHSQFEKRLPQESLYIASRLSENIEL